MFKHKTTFISYDPKNDDPPEPAEPRALPESEGGMGEEWELVSSVCVPKERGVEILWFWKARV